MRNHGTRAKYVVEKCRCEPCTIANRLYARERDRHTRRSEQGIETFRPPYIDATETREHLQWLQSKGMGRRQIHKISGVAISSIQKIRTGKITKCRPETAARIMAIGSHKAAPGVLIDAKPTWKLIDDLIKHGWTRYQIAQYVSGNPNATALQISRNKVRKSTADKIREFHDRKMFRVIEQRRQSKERQRKSRAARATVTPSRNADETMTSSSNRSLAATLRT